MEISQSKTKNSKLDNWLASWKHKIALNLALVVEMPVLSFHLISNVASTLIGHFETHYHQPFVSHLSSISEIVKERFPSMKSHLFSSLSDAFARDSCAATDDFDLVSGVKKYENWTIDHVLDHRFNRPNASFEPPKTWPLPISLTVSAVRGLLHNNISLNVIRVLGDFTYIFYPSFMHILKLPTNLSSMDLAFYTHGISPFYRFDKLVASDFSDISYKSPIHPKKLGVLTLIRFSVHLGNEGDPDFIGGEWSACNDLILEKQSLMKFLYGAETVAIAYELYEILKQAQSTNWWLDLAFIDTLKYSQAFLSTSSLHLKRWLHLPKQKIFDAFMKYRLCFQRLSHHGEQNEVVKAVSKNQKIILYLHGGGYCIMSAESHRGLIWNIAKETGAHVIAINYRRTPEYHFPAALEDAMSTYLQLIFPSPPTQNSHDVFDYLGLGIPHPAMLTGECPLLPVSANQVVIMGDSAGGGLVLSLLLHIRDSGVPQPQCAVMMSPWLDLGCSLPSWNINHSCDYLPRMDFRKYENLMSAFTNWKDELISNPLVSPIYGNINDLPPILVQVGQCEYLLDDSLLLAQKMKYRRTGVKNQFKLEVYQDMVHVWHFLEFVTPARVAFKRIGRFVKEHLNYNFVQCFEDGHDMCSVINMGVEEEKQKEERPSYEKILYISVDGEEHEIIGKLKLGGQFKIRSAPVEMN